MLEAIGERASLNPSRLYRVGTGELIDSLVWDDLTDFTTEIVPFIGSLPNVILELKSKDDCVDNLVALKDKHNGNTVVSWSVNARSVSEKDETSTATLDERVAAAKRVVDAGYRVGFHFDPLVLFDGWEEDYREAVETIFSQIPSTAVAWVSVSSLRYQPDMQRIMMQRFPDSSLPFGEQFQSKDSKLRYIQPIRFKMLRFVWEQLKSVREDMPVYMCMESSSAWRSINGGAPVAGSELAEVFTRRGKLPILPSGGPA
jgi:spore photoproduct lyase